MFWVWSIHDDHFNSLKCYGVIKSEERVSIFLVEKVNDRAMRNKLKSGIAVPVEQKKDLAYKTTTGTVHHRSFHGYRHL